MDVRGNRGQVPRPRPPRLRFYLDADLSPRIAEALRKRDIDAVSAHDVGKSGLSDKEQLIFAGAQRRCFVTRNREDFITLSRDAIRNHEPHAGIAICASSFTGAEIGRITRAVIRLAERYPRGLGQYDVVYLA